MDPTVPPFPAPKPRPRAWWFVLGTVLLLAAVAVAVPLALRAFDGFLTVDARVANDGVPHDVRVDTDRDLYLWVRETEGADCSIRDAVRNADVPLSPVNADISRGTRTGSWVVDGRFPPGSGQLTVTCSAEAGPVEIGPALDVKRFVTYLLLAILVPLALGGLGAVILIVTGILWAVRPART